MADSLAGRMEDIRLLTLSQTEILGKKSRFIDRACAAQKPFVDHMIIGNDLAETVLTGGYRETFGETECDAI
ncbi:hypothetical protein FGD77_09675 [Roseovarius sp. M141]|nr:hypothetical protein [Roseovarius sp. M141]